MARGTVVIGLTGGIASGKSTVSATLKRLGAVVVDADKVGHEVYLPDTDAWKEIVEAFGKAVLLPNGEIDRKKLGEIVFKDPRALGRLNAIVHPRMRSLMKERIDELKRQGVKAVVLEAAVLFEAKWTPLVDEVWVTLASEATAIDRLRRRNGLSEEQAQARLRAQISGEEKARQANVVINTDCSLEETERQVEQLWKRLISN